MSTTPHVTTREELPKTTAAAVQIDVYGPPQCPNCRLTEAFLDKHGLAYDKTVLSPGDENHRYVAEQLGHQQAPVIVAHFEDHPDVNWSGHRLDMLRALSKIRVG